jgi:mono/diheme cytochrome c family protein
MKIHPLLAASLLVLGGCSKSDASASTSSAAPPPPAALDAFKTRCAPCHGESGHGDGPASAALTPKPRNYTDGTWQKSVKDDDIRKTILYGGAAVGKSPAMPASPDLDGKPELEGLVAVVRGFGPK